MNTKQRFSLRKYKVGAVSVLLGTLLFMCGVTTASADAVTNDSSVASLVQSASAQEAPSSSIAAIVKEKAPVATVQAMPSSTDTNAQGGAMSTAS
ncbi:YSIRK-type signal peptide-containing protein [Streptococcus dysgalactiae]|nr:YSIRK-type signal peptide-containing protein [Streptococcus dysgalactiae]QQT04624.1 YSIRK-type signal peptide-containing protein [Streptococcus dysgalactiae]SUN44830.1 cell-surface protease required for virulence cell [Streptococcus dysgalactiae subsp. dysgalactiae]SUN49423.1 cell-surface protease required for virulence cell [Streptococcus dysgalactiae]SUN54939.1 cell-surface protease required for virulence cell [Streptococcus dysgalactiae]